MATAKKTTKVTRKKSTANTGWKASVNVDADKYMLMKIGKEFHLLERAKLAWLQSEGAITFLYMLGADKPAFRIAKNLGRLAPYFEPYGFVRASNQVMVNSAQVKSFTGSTNDCVITLMDGRKLKASRRFRDNYVAAFEKHGPLLQIHTPRTEKKAARKTAAKPAAKAKAGRPAAAKKKR